MLYYCYFCPYLFICLFSYLFIYLFIVCDFVDQQAINLVHQQIHQACKDIGFFYITGHGVEQSTIDLLYSYAQTFFALPLEKKNSISILKSPNYNGYIEPGTS